MTPSKTKTCNDVITEVLDDDLLAIQAAAFAKAEVLLMLQMIRELQRLNAHMELVLVQGGKARGKRK